MYSLIHDCNVVACSPDFPGMVGKTLLDCLKARLKESSAATFQRRAKLEETKLPSSPTWNLTEGRLLGVSSLRAPRFWHFLFGNQKENPLFGGSPKRRHSHFT